MPDMSSDPKCRETGPLVRHGVLGLALASALLVVPIGAGDAPGASQAVRREVAIDMASGWLRRDWQGCSDPTRVTFREGAIAFESRSSSALVWQVPTPNGPFVIDPTLDWVRQCDRPPISFFKRLVADRGTAMLPDLSEVPHLVWRWRVEGAIDDSEIARPDGRIRSGHDDFAAKLGVLVQAQGGKDVHEIAYVWARSLPLGTALYQETTVIPLVFKARAGPPRGRDGRGPGSVGRGGARPPCRLRAALSRQAGGPRAAPPPHDRLGRHRRPRDGGLRRHPLRPPGSGAAVAGRCRPRCTHSEAAAMSFPNGPGFWRKLLHRAFDHLHWHHHREPSNGRTSAARCATRGPSSQGWLPSRRPSPRRVAGP